ncbi:MAG: hypothetical protein KAW12_26610 [Candidatus Aminicenantes bacterium]|nr:hypothetical protein [Candidatus Aminicenantes bacterium]
MQDLTLKIRDELKTLHPLYMKEVYDFITFLKAKQEKNDDTEYLSSIPGMVESIITEAKRPLSEYSDTLDW